MTTPTSTLAQLHTGDRGRIIGVRGDDAVSVRLLELGLLPGVEVEVLGVAPFGDPLAVALKGTRLAIRRRDAQRIELLHSPAGDRASCGAAN